MRINATRKAGGSARSQTAARSAAHTPGPAARSRSSASSMYCHGAIGSAGMICTGWSNCEQNRAARLGWRVMTVCTASRSRCGSSGPVTVMSSCIAYSIAGILGGAGVEEQSLLQGGQRQDIGDPVVLRPARRSGVGSAGRGRCRTESARLRRVGHERRCRPARQTTAG